MKRRNSALSRVFTALVFVFLYAPIFLLIIFSFNAGNSNIVWSGFSLNWYRELLHNRLILRSVYTTLLVSLLATAIATFAGTFAAIGFYSLRRRQRNLLNTVNNIPMMNADIVTGVAMCLFFVAFFGLWSDFANWFNGVQHFIELPSRLTLGFGTLLIAHVAFNIPYVILSVGPKLRQMDKNLVDAAQDLGCTWMQAFWKVILPEINAVSTLLFVTVLLLLVITNLREARLERMGADAPRRSRTAERIATVFSTPKGRWIQRGGAGVLAAGFLTAIILLTGATNSHPVVNVCSWGEYIDEELITQFEEETGIAVNYQTAESNEALYSLLKSGAGDYDVIVPSDYMISQLIEEDMLEKLDYGNIPNFSLISERFRNLPYDPQNEYTVPYAWGTVGIIYNTTMVDEPITSWDAMFDSRYQGEVLMFRNSRDAMATALLKLGYSLNTTDEAELREAFQLLQDAKSRGVYQSFVMDEIFQKLEGANAAVGAYYAGDYISMLENNEDLALVIPEEGSNWFMDAMCVLKDAPHKEEAEVWMNFIASTEANLANMDFIGYASPNEEALAQYPAYYEELYGEPLDPEIYEIMAVPQEILDKCEAYLVLPAETRKLYNDLWTELGI